MASKIRRLTHSSVLLTALLSSCGSDGTSGAMPLPAMTPGTSGSGAISAQSGASAMTGSVPVGRSATMPSTAGPAAAGGTRSTAPATTPASSGVGGMGGVAMDGAPSSAGNSSPDMTPMGMAGVGAAGMGSAETPTGEQRTEGCGKDAPAVVSMVDFNGVSRQIIVDVPKTYDNNRAYPLIFSWHGANVGVAMFHMYLGIAKAVGEDGITISLETATGSSGSWDYTNDPLFFDFLVEKFSKEYCVDKHRIFTTGHSMGGFFNHNLACVRGNVLRAAAPLAANAMGGGTCTGKPAIWYSQGEDDFAGNGPNVRDYWTGKNGCDTSKSTPVSPLPCDGTGTMCECLDYTAGCEDSPVRYCTFPGGHEIPSFIGPGVWAYFQTFK